MEREPRPQIETVQNAPHASKEERAEETFVEPQDDSESLYQRFLKYMQELNL